MLTALDWSTAAITAAVTAAVFGLISKLGGTGWFPHLPEADPDQEPTAGDRRRYYAANALAVLAGAALAVLLAELTRLDAQPYRYSAFDGAGRWLGAGFFGLGMAAWLAMLLLERMVAPGPLLHLLHRSSARHNLRGLDCRPGTRKLGLLVATLALLLHFALRHSHTTLTATGVRWRDYPWQQEASRPWRELRDVRIVRTFVATTGRTVERPHLGLEFADGTVLHLGRRDTRPPGFWQQPAAFAEQQSGLRVRHVDRDDG